ncbi:hypothetical protein GIB67_011439 [Kingdonia uniflora]|uniref:Uncharacterized protein n=1 Tax=Kingdonia uniflora TaxID=39325 RepID=A0A7J7NM42_9MAGN|nr:hypothetical protein GIB67_011439 [Kingdonia uniflora]
MAASSSAYADVMEILACAMGTSSSLIRRPRIKKTVPPSEQTAPVQIPPVGTEGVDADVNMAPPLKKQKNESDKDIRASSKGVNLEAVEQEALDLATRDPIRLDTQIRSSISQLSVAWKSVAKFEQEKVLQREQFVKEKALQKDKFEKEAAATKQEVKDEAKKAVNIAVVSRNKLIQAFYFWDLSREDVDLALTGKYGEIVFPGDDASPVAEQTLAPPVVDDPTKEEVVHLRGKVIEMEKALSRARNSINRTQQGQKAMRILFFNIKKEDRKIHVQLEIDLRHPCDELEQCKGHNACLEREKVECARLLQSSEKRVTLLEARLLDTQQRLQQYLLAVERTTLLNSKLESEMLELQSRLNAVTVELSCKDAEILAANNEFELWNESLKKKKLETMAANQQVLDLLSTIEKQKNYLLYHQLVITNNIDLLKKQDSKIRYMRERLKKLNWDLREARDSCQRKNDRAKNHEEACSKRDRELNEAINKCNSRIANLDWDKQALVLECMQGNKVFEELHMKYKESQRMLDAAEAEINYSREVDKKLHHLKQKMERSVQMTKQYRGSLLQEKKSLEARCKDLEDELNKVKTKFYEATLLTTDNVTLRAMAMLHADVEKF